MSRTQEDQPLYLIIVAANIIVRLIVFVVALPFLRRLHHLQQWQAEAR